ncbi:MBL fold metallo-hydrolase [Peribacillus sp. SCS-155]|uniref:MBL fold metallo-hydrolase n=1 Tax=Peribacillus sedimenti TaxID=3115297 RepID=UPI00390670FE
MEKSVETFKESKHFRLHRVADGVFAAISVPGTGSVGNAAIIDLGDKTIVVDTFTTIQAAEDLQAAAISVTGNSASYVINTHWHSDHTSGNQVFTPNAPIISTTATRDIMAAFGVNRINEQLTNLESIFRSLDELEEKLQKEKDKKLQEEMKWGIASDREYMKILPNLLYTLPSITFDRGLSIHGSERSVQLFSFGGGHTQSDTFVYLPEEKIAVMGDLVLSKHHPVLNHANPKEWLHILERIESLDIEIIIPGHGEVCSMEQVYQVKGYIKDIMTLVAESMESDTNIDDISVPEAYQDWYFTTYFKTNLKKVYELLTAPERSIKVD